MTSSKTSNSRWAIDRTVNLTDLASVILSVAAFGLSLFNLWLLLGGDGNPISLPPRQVLFVAQHYPSSNRDIARFAASRQYINDTRFGASVIVTNEILLVTFGDNSHKYIWQAIGNFKFESGQPKHEEGRGPTAELVRPGDAVGHEVYYAPASVPDDSLEWDKFLERMEECGEVRFTFVTVFYKQPETSYVCRIPATPELLKVLRARKWDAPACLPVPQSIPSLCGRKAG